MSFIALGSLDLVDGILNVTNTSQVLMYVLSPIEIPFFYLYTCRDLCMADKTCPRLTVVDGYPTDTKQRLLETNQNCRGVTIYKYVLEKLTDIIKDLNFVSSENDFEDIIKNMNEVSNLLRDPEISALLRSVTYGKYHSDDIGSKIKTLKNKQLQIRNKHNDVIENDDSTPDLDRIRLEGVNDPESPSPRAP